MASADRELESLVAQSHANFRLRQRTRAALVYRRDGTGENGASGEYPCERCGRSMFSDWPKYATVSMFCSESCKRRHDGVSIAALRRINADVCDECGEFIGTARAAMYALEPLDRYNRGHLWIYELVHERCLGRHLAVPGTDATAGEETPEARLVAGEVVYAGSSSLRDAVRNGSMSEALSLLKGLMPHVTLGLREVQAWGWSVPTVRYQIAAVAALYGDADLESMIEEVSQDERTANWLVPGDVKAMRDTMLAIGGALNVQPALTRVDLRKASAVSDGRWFSRALDYLLKSQRISVRGDTYSLGADEPAPTRPAPVAFRQDAEPHRPDPIYLDEYPRVAGPDTYEILRRGSDASLPKPALASEKLDTGPNATLPTLQTTPPDRRISGKARAAVTANSTWLITYAKPAGVSERQYTATIADRSGTLVRTLAMPSPVRDFVAGFDRDWVTVLGADLTIRVYRDDGELLDSIVLDQSAEVRYCQARGVMAQGTTWLSGFDYDRATRRILYALQDAVWCVSNDGEVLWSRQMPPKLYPSGAWTPEERPSSVRRRAAKYGFRADVTARELASFIMRVRTADAGSKSVVRETDGASWRALETTLGEISSDLIHSAVFTPMGVRVSTRYGLSIDLDDQGRIMRMWNTDGGADQLVSLAGKSLAKTGSAIVSIDDTPYVTVTGDAPVPQRDATYGPDPVTVMVSIAEQAAQVVATNDWVAIASKHQVRVATAPTWHQRDYRLPQEVTALVVEERGLRVHMRTKSLLIEI